MFIEKALKQNLDFLERFLDYEVGSRVIDNGDIEDILIQMPAEIVDQFWVEMLNKEPIKKVENKKQIKLFTTKGIIKPKYVWVGYDNCGTELVDIKKKSVIEKIEMNNRLFGNNLNNINVNVIN